ncbi:DUF1963 domain-containing protein [Celerinatantimonas diazotrophica]|uniref:Uncharacterized protein YwqG n=1 Tax=Celerinatantimonas diazotrophica TaxID=412034 RepID=A0A4R1JA44_9GAMM|nr:DUF1963 domain-containing protein [Celerinatantimonas diazotrophica]TCK47503.1 uncharacterized protein YwqG [Celerinatantimonas diazotrophica]CAG9296879.1 hypothetical protein CEDIAZO_02038 [Celerinatantimonas diazotrophica]
MDELIGKFREVINRKAIVLDIGGFRPPEDPFFSWFGKVSFCRSGEEWPMQDGEPMHALAQINLTDFPFKPKGLEDIEFITIFIGPEELPIHASNGNNWQIRTYEKVSDLIPLNQIETGSWIKSLPMKSRLVEEDYPCWDDVPVECPEEIDDDYYDLFDNVSGFKFGGWPTLLQAEIFWAPWNKHDACPEYIFQIDTTEKGNWMWGDNGVGYFGKGTAEGKENEWALSWQCY